MGVLTPIIRAVAILADGTAALLVRYRQALLDLQMVAEANAGQTIEPSHKRKRTSLAPPHVTSESNEEIEALELAVARAEAKVAHHRRRPPDRIPEYRDWAKWVVSVYAGVPAVVVAQREACHRNLIYKVRKQAKRNPVDGELVASDLAA